MRNFGDQIKIKLNQFMNVLYEEPISLAKLAILAN